MGRKKSSWSRTAQGKSGVVTKESKIESDFDSLTMAEGQLEASSHKTTLCEGEGVNGALMPKKLDFSQENNVNGHLTTGVNAEQEQGHEPGQHQVLSHKNSLDGVDGPIDSDSSNQTAEEQEEFEVDTVLEKRMTTTITEPTLVPSGPADTTVTPCPSPSTVKGEGEGESDEKNNLHLNISASVVKEFEEKTASKLEDLTTDSKNALNTTEEETETNSLSKSDILNSKQDSPSVQSSTPITSKDTSPEKDSFGSDLATKPSLLAWLFWVIFTLPLSITLLFAKCLTLFIVFLWSPILFPTFYVLKALGLHSYLSIRQCVWCFLTGQTN